MPLTRREAIAGCGGGLAWLAAWPALAQSTYPSRAIRMIVPYPPGGTTDLLGRMIADQLKSGLGATVVVENKPGAATTLGADLVAKSEPDGYTLLMATSTTLAINKTLYRKLPYDPVKDFDIRHVPYRGSVPAMLDVIAGHIPFMVVDLQPALQQIREGKVRVLGVTTPKRVAIAPEIPTIPEAGLAGFELVAWQGVVAPAGTPRPVVDALAAQLAKLMADPATRDRLTTLSLEPLPPSTPDSFAAYISTEVERWAVIVKNSGAELE